MSQTAIHPTNLHVPNYEFSIFGARRQAPAIVGEFDKPHLQDRKAQCESGSVGRVCNTILTSSHLLPLPLVCLTHLTPPAYSFLPLNAPPTSHSCPTHLILVFIEYMNGSGWKLVPVVGVAPDSKHQQ